MNYLVFTKSTETSDCYKLEDLRVVEVPNTYSPEDQRKYAKDLYLSFFEDCPENSVIVIPVDGYMASIEMPTDKIRRLYEESEMVTVLDRRKGTSYAGGIIIGRIPAGQVPTEDEILKLYFRGNYERMKAHDQLDVICTATPFDRVAIDFGTFNTIFPETENYKIVKE